MKIVINAVLTQCILCYSQQVFQLTWELLLIMFIHSAAQKEDAPHVDFNTRTQTTIY